MKLQQSFEVQAPAARVWSLLTDLASVAPCLPGAELNEQGEDGSYGGTFTVKVGPTTASYRGSIAYRERDDGARRAVMHASGQDKGGQGGVTATMITSVLEHGTSSTVMLDTDLLITGKLARFGRGGMIEDISNRLLSDFATCLQAKLAEPVAEPVGAVDGGDAAASTAYDGPPPLTEPPAPPAAGGANLPVPTFTGHLRRRAPAIGVAALLLALLFGWRAAHHRRR
jgi:carbon monoxide dehydrogenase subunit G